MAGIIALCGSLKLEEVKKLITTTLTVQDRLLSAVNVPLKRRKAGSKPSAVRESVYELRLLELREYQVASGNCNDPSPFPENPE